jgi:branched-subunit amino acid transport protein AzlD
MNLSSVAIIIIAAVFTGSFLVMIPFAIFQNQRKQFIICYKEK